MIMIQNQLRTQDSEDYLQDMILGDLEIDTKTYQYIIALIKSLVFLKIRKVPVSSKYIRTIKEMFKHTKKSCTASMKS